MNIPPMTNPGPASTVNGNGSVAHRESVLWAVGQYALVALVTALLMLWQAGAERPRTPTHRAYIFHGVECLRVIAV